MSDPFPKTLWTEVVEPGQRGHEGALNRLIGIYREPIVKHLTRKLGPNDGEDAAQDYLLGLLESGYLRRASANRGKFRAFLLHDLKLFILGWHRSRNTIKRGGKAEKLSYEAAIEAGMQIQDGETDSQDEDFDRDWMLCVMKRAHSELEEIYRAKGNEERFQALEQFIELGGDAQGYVEAGKQLGVEPSAVKVAVSRLRRAYAQILRDQVQQAIGEGESVEEELDYLKKCYLNAMRRES